MKRYGERTVVDGVGFEIVAGETYGLLGPNGAGKTTAISMITGVLERDAGEVVVNDVSISPGTRSPRSRSPTSGGGFGTDRC